LRTTRHAAANAGRLDQRRRQYEHQAMQSHAQPTGTEADWQRIAPLLDDAMDHLPEKDRDAVVLRFFDQMPLKLVSWSHRIEIFRDGYVPKYVSWSEHQQDRIEEMPAEYTVQLDPAVTKCGCRIRRTQRRM
jgi:hypothetical protein